MSPPKLSKADALAVFWHVLAKIAPKRAQRDALAPIEGSKCRVQDFELHAKIGRHTIDERIPDGDLCVAEDSQRAQTVACDQVELLACVAESMTKPHRERVFRSILETYRGHGSLPAVEPAIVAACKGLVEQLRDAKTVPVKGTVRYVGDEEPA